MDLTNFTFGDFTVTSQAPFKGKNKHIQWNCKCEKCGAEKVMSGTNIRRGYGSKCECSSDRTGMHYNGFTVIKFDHKDERRKYWLCQCDCGEMFICRDDQIESRKYGCMQCKNADKMKNIIIDITGQKFGRLTAIERNPIDGKWLFRCECGTEKWMQPSAVKNGVVVSCGCYHNEQLSNRNFINEVGNQYGKLTVLYRAEDKHSSDGKPITVWHCKCECGNECDATAHSLRCGEKNSCGCINSKGNTLIEIMLRDNGIEYEREKWFDTCRLKETNYPAKFDFYLPTYNCCIEYDGLQHFEYRGKESHSWNTKENYDITVSRDKQKNEWCFANDITLIRIPYWHINDLTLDDLLPSTSKFILRKDGDTNVA